MYSPHVLKYRKKAPTTWSHACKPPLGIMRAGLTSGVEEAVSETSFGESFSIVSFVAGDTCLSVSWSVEAMIAACVCEGPDFRVS